MKKLFLAFSLMLFAVAMMAQRTVSGTVTDQGGETLIGASVFVKGTTTGTVTDIDGKYTIELPADSKTLIFSYTGFTSKEVEIGASNNIDVTLSEGVTLETAVVTALGISRDEKSVGYAVQSVGSEDIGKANTVSAIDALSGKVSGVQITSSNGSAGAPSRIVLRGQSSFNGNNQPLIVVDGVRMSNAENHTERSLQGVSNSNRAIDINPNDIENVSVLKGAAATALYGIDGANGVLLITTKKGAAGDKVKVEYSTNYSISQVSNMVELQDKFSQGGTGTWAGPDGFDPVWWGGFVRAVSWGAQIDTLHYDGSDYVWDNNGRIVGQSDPNAGAPVVPYDNVDDFFQDGKTWSNNVSVSGGNENSNYRFSFGNTKVDGIAPNNTFERTTFGVNLGTKMLDDRLTISSAINFSRSGGTRIQQGSNISGVMLGLLRTPVTFDNSNGTDNGADSPEAYQFTDGSQRNYRGGGGYDNPFWVVNNTPFNDDVNRLYGNISAAYKLHDWAIVSATLGTDFYNDNRVQEFEIGSRTQPAGQVLEDNYIYRHTDIYLNLNGTGKLSTDFSLGYNVGMNLYDSRLKNNFTQGDGLNFFGFRSLSNTSSNTTTVDHNNIKNVGLFGSVDLGFKNFLYLTITGRNDWNSTLIVPSKEFNASDISFFYPSVSLGFVFSELMSSSALSFGKIRASYAEVGGGAPSAYSTTTAFTVPQYNGGTINDLNDGWTNGVGLPYQGAAGFVLNGVAGNASLTPSRTKEFEVGADVRFFNNRVGLDVSYYDRQSIDQIIAINIANTTGFQRAIVNGGELKTQGVGLVLNTVPVKTKNFDWSLDMNFSKWKTTVESLPEGVQNQYLDGFTGTGIYNIAPDTDDNGNVTTVYEYGQILGGAFQRVNDGNNGFDASLPYNPDGAIVIDDSGSPDPDAADYNGNYGFPLVDPANQILGNPNPDFLLGITNTLRYKNLSLSFLFDIKQGGDMWNGTAGALTFFGRTELTADRDPVVWNDNQGWVGDYETATHVFEGVLASDGSANSIKAPLTENWYTGNGGGFGAVAENFVEDASYMKLRFATLSYNLGGLDAIGLEDLTISFTGRNLIIITDYSGVDPETSLVGSGSNGQGLDYFQLPGTRTYAFGLSARF